MLPSFDNLAKKGEKLKAMRPSIIRIPIIHWALCIRNENATG
jgi:hypothetical protein